MKMLLRKIITFVVQRLRYYSYRIQGYDIHISTQMERNLNLDRLNPKGIHIGRNTIITSRVTILSHYVIPVKKENRYTGKNVDTYVGDNCVIGVGAIILAGVRIGNDVVVGAGSVVTRDVPSNMIIAGNPAKIVKADVSMDNLPL